MVRPGPRQQDIPFPDGADGLSFCFPLHEGLFARVRRNDAFILFPFFVNTGGIVSILSFRSFKPAFVLDGKHLWHSFYHAGHNGSVGWSHNPDFLLPRTPGKDIFIPPLSISYLYAHENLFKQDSTWPDSAGVIKRGGLDSRACNPEWNTLEKRGEAVRGDGGLAPGGDTKKAHSAERIENSEIKDTVSRKARSELWLPDFKMQIIKRKCKMEIRREYLIFP